MFNVDDRVRHIFRPEYGIGIIHTILGNSGVVFWEKGGSSYEPFNNLTKEK